jgi:glutamine amidotransferase
MVAVIDYGVGNLFSLRCSLEKLGADVVVTGDKALIERADRVILPGVGAFRDARQKLRDTGLDTVVCALAEQGKPILGICLGMQLLFEKSFEDGEWDGLGLLPGNIVPLRGAVPDELPVPHIGWNPLAFPKKDPLFREVEEGTAVYFVHSYYAVPDENTVATAGYGVPVTAAVRRGNVAGCQFHPEKSGAAGLRILRAFVEGEQI